MQRKLNRYFSAVFGEGLVPSKSPASRDKLQYYLENLFDGIDFKNKSVLDIGGGSGIFSFYAASLGASSVLCLEPEAAGSRSGMLDKFRRAQDRLHLDQVRIEPITFQAFDPGHTKFDIVFLHNSVNHLDETACVNLLTDENARDAYRTIFSKIHGLCADGGQLIVCDCSRYNLFAHMKIKNPLAPSIEWHKHQSPKAWMRLLQDAGFRNAEIDWRAPSSLRSAGNRLFGNKLSAYFLTSHFRLRMEKPHPFVASADAATDITARRPDRLV